jgi:hypothetical protein
MLDLHLVLMTQHRRFTNSIEHNNGIGDIEGHFTHETESL